jgi:hypothetical protein
MILSKSIITEASSIIIAEMTIYSTLVETTVTCIVMNLTIFTFTSLHSSIPIQHIHITELFSIRSHAQEFISRIFIEVSKSYVTYAVTIRVFNLVIFTVTISTRRNTIFTKVLFESIITEAFTLSMVEVSIFFTVINTSIIYVKDLTISFTFTSIFY